MRSFITASILSIAMIALSTLSSLNSFGPGQRPLLGVALNQVRGASQNNTQYRTTSCSDLNASPGEASVGGTSCTQQGQSCVSCEGLQPTGVTASPDAGGYLWPLGTMMGSYFVCSTDYYSGSCQPDEAVGDGTLVCIEDPYDGQSICAGQIRRAVHQTN